MARSNRRRQRPSDPAEAASRAYEARRNPALWGPNTEALNLPQNSDVQTTQPETRTKTRRIERFDCFSTLKLSDHQFTAVRRYQADLAEAHGVGDRDTMAEVVDGGGSRELVTARMMAAHDRVLSLAVRLSIYDLDLLGALSVPSVVRGEAVNWKAIVRKLRGLIDRDAQAQAVKTLSENVRLAYAEIDGMGVRRAA